MIIARNEVTKQTDYEYNIFNFQFLRLKYNGMIKFLVFLSMLPLLVHTQPKQSPYVTFKDGKILYFIPRSEPQMLPVIKPPYVDILQTATPGTNSFTQTNKELSKHLVALSARTLSETDKEDFLASVACLILLNCDRPDNIDTAFIAKAKAMEKDKDVRNEAGLVIKLWGAYKNK